MNVLIIEDEKLAAEHLEKLLHKADPSINIITIIDSIKKSVVWFNTNPLPNLVFMDIQLADGLSFEIFDKVQINSPVIFTTAYDEYAIKAFKVNSIDYLLKPIDVDGLKNALNKYYNNYIKLDNSTNTLKALDKVVRMLGKSYKNRFLVKVGEHLRFINIDEITYFYSLDKGTFLNTQTNKNYDIDCSLDDLETQLDPEKFFRINRKYLVGINSIIDIVAYTNSRLKLKLINSTDDTIIVSREKVNDFKKWLEG
jgi:DNA-binding LytR/AlgR family response regulator